MCRNVKENKLLFVRAFDEWIFDMQTSKTRKPFDRMVAIATRFKEILEENGLLDAKKG